MCAVYRASVAQARGDVEGTVALGTAVDTFTEAVASLHAAGMVADELGATGRAREHVAGARTSR